MVGEYEEVVERSRGQVRAKWFEVLMIKVND